MIDRTTPLLAILILLAAGCGDDPEQGADLGMAPDSGPGLDIGKAPDRGASPDRGTSPDSKPKPDLPPAPDAGSGPCNKPPPAGWKFTPGEAYWGRKDYIEYIAGDLPVVISSPHGGYLTPSEIKDRTYGVLGRDSNSQEYTLEAAHYLLKLTGRRPHVIINRLYRKKLDANRDIKEASQGDKWSEQAWNDYHKFIDGAKGWVTAACGKGHYFDFHTNGHSAKWVELGHLLSSTDLNRNNAALDDVAFVNKSSLRTIAKLPGYKLSDLVRGPFSLGTLLMSRGYKAVPSALNPHPAGQGFFNGGYNTSRHGSRIGGTIDGTQVETYSGMISTLSGRDNYAYMLALSIRDFLEHHYKWKLKDPAWRPPAHQACLAAKKIQLVNGGALITGSTAGASNEFGQQINCGGSNAWDGHQVYYRVKLIPGANYEISLTPSFSARLYLFGDSCSPSTINIQCAKSGLSGKLIVPNQTITTAVKAGPYSLHTIAVDANSKPYYGSFKLQIKKL